MSGWIFGAILRRGLKSKVSVSTYSNSELLGDEGLLHLPFTPPSTFTITQSPSCTLLSPAIYHLSCCATVLKGSPATSPHSLTPVYLAMYCGRIWHVGEQICSMEILDAHPWPLQYYSGTSFCWCNLRRGDGWNQPNVAVWIWNLSDSSSWSLSPEWSLSTQP